MSKIVFFESKNLVLLLLLLISLIPQISITNSTTNIWENERITGIIDFNDNGNEFNLETIDKNIDSGFNMNYSSSLTQDFNPSVNNRAFFNYWKNDGTDLLLLHYYQSYFGLNIGGFNTGITINGTLPMFHFFQRFPINSEIDSITSFSFLGFLLENKFGESFIGYSLAPDDLKEFFLSNVNTDFPDLQVSMEVMRNKVEITYSNLLLFWSNIPPNNTASLLGYSSSLTMPLLFHPSVTYLTFIKRLSLNFNILETQITQNNHPLYEIEQSFQIDDIEYFGFNESLPSDINWNSSIEILNDVPLVIDFPLITTQLEYSLKNPFSIYANNEVEVRLSQISEDLSLSSLIGIRNYLYNKNEFTGKFIPHSVFNSNNEDITDKNDIELVEFLSWNIQNVENSEIERNSYYQLDTRGQNLFQLNNELNPVINTAYANSDWKPGSQKIDFYNELLKPYTKFLNNFSESIGIPFGALTLPLRTDTFEYIIKSSFTPLTKHTMKGYLPYLKMLDPYAEVDTTNGTIQQTSGFSAILLGFGFILIIMIRNNKIKIK